MRQIWVVSDDKTIAEHLNAALTYDVYGVRYVVSQTDSIAKVPDADLRDPGVVFLVDAFHSSTAGFTGARELRRRNFPGHIFLCGEPAPEEAVGPFHSGEISAFLPPMHRLDFSFTAGLIHSALYYSQELRLSYFLGKGGRASTETIRSISDFNHLTMKLISFVSRFGVDIQKVKKVLVSVAYSHVVSSPAGVTIPKPFKLSFGLDPKKIIIATSLELDPAQEVQVRDEFCTTLAEHRLTAPGGKPVRPDFKNTAKLAENFSLIWGDAAGAEAWKTSTSAYILVAIPFNFQTAKGERPYFFSYVKVKATAEKNAIEKEAPPETGLEAKVTLETVETAEDSSTRSTVLPTEETLGSGTSVSHEPEILGDLPKSLEVPNPEGDLRVAVSESPVDDTGQLDMPPPSETPIEDTSDLSTLVEQGEEIAPTAQTSEEFQELQNKLEAVQKEFQEQKVLAKSLAEDVKRLMKERRQPISQGELKEINDELNGKIERLQMQNKALTDEIATKETRLKDLEEQIKRLKVAA